MTLRLIIDFEIPDRLVGLYAESSTCAYVGNKEGELSIEQAAANLQRYAETKTYGAFERIGFMKIYKGDTLVGFSMPREIKAKENAVFLLEEGSQWYRIGTVYIAKQYRRQGIMRETIKEFVKLYPNVLWTCNATNTASYNSALSGGLEYSHSVYVGENRYWEHQEHDNVIRVDCVFKSCLPNQQAIAS